MALNTFSFDEIPVVSFCFLRAADGLLGFRDTVWRAAGVLTALGQHALLHLLQLLRAVAQLHGGLKRALPSPQTFAAGHAAVTPVRPRRQQAGDRICVGGKGLTVMCLFLYPVFLVSWIAAC